MLFLYHKAQPCCPAYIYHMNFVGLTFLWRILVTNLYGIMGWDDPDYHVACNGAPLQKFRM
jgi:hypothetical protein